MSYCRWSSDGFYCDLYCYEGEDGFVTHIASRRRPTRAPALVWDQGVEKLMETRAAQDAFLEDEVNNPLVPIGLPLDGKSFTDGDLESFLERLRSLKEMGYQFPDGVITSVEEELAEEREKDLQEQDAASNRAPPGPSM